MKKCLQCRRNTARRDSLYCGKCEAVISDAVEQQSLLEAVRHASYDVPDGPLTLFYIEQALRSGR